MKRIAFLAISVALLLPGISVFALGHGPTRTAQVSYQDTSGTSGQDPAAPLIGVSSVQEWLGKTTVQLVAQLGAPDFTFVTDNGDKESAPSQSVMQTGRAGIVEVTQSESIGDITYAYNKRTLPITKNNSEGNTQLEFGIMDGIVMSASSTSE